MFVNTAPLVHTGQFMLVESQVMHSLASVCSVMHITDRSYTAQFKTIVHHFLHGALHGHWSVCTNSMHPAFTSDIYNGQSSHSTFTSLKLFDTVLTSLVMHTAMPDEARGGRNTTLKWQFKVTSHLLACLIVQTIILLSTPACLITFIPVSWVVLDQLIPVYHLQTQKNRRKVSRANSNLNFHASVVGLRDGWHTTNPISLASPTYNHHTCIFDIESYSQRSTDICSPACNPIQRWLDESSQWSWWEECSRWRRDCQDAWESIQWCVIASHMHFLKINVDIRWHPYIRLNV